MKKLLGILVLAFLFSGNANAGVNEPGRGPFKKCESNFKLQHGIIIYEQMILTVAYNGLSSRRIHFSIANTGLSSH